MRISRLTAIAARFTLHGMSPGKRDRVARHHPHWVGSLVRKVEIEPLGLAGPAPHGRPLVAPFVKEAPFVEDAVRVIIKTAGVGRDARAFWTLLPKCGAASCLSMAAALDQNADGSCPRKDLPSACSGRGTRLTCAVQESGNLAAK